MQTDRTSISAKVIADSVHDGSRLTTIEATFPRFILAEFNTHRVLSRNSASSRAIPVWKKLADAISHPFVPLSFGKNKAGMQSAENVPDQDTGAAKENWLIGKDVAVIQAFFLAGGEKQILSDAKGDVRAVSVCDSIYQMRTEYSGVFSKFKPLSVGVHKQHANRVLEPYAWHTVVMTATRWRNFYALRASTMAQPEIQALAIAMAKVHLASVPNELDHREWHLPYIFPEDRDEVKDPRKLARISTARCARISVLAQDGKRLLEKDFNFADDLQGNGHTSPFEHPATTHDTTGAYFGSFHGNFDSAWMQYRKMLLNEHDFSRLISQDSLYLGTGQDQALVDFILSLRD